MAVAFPCIFTTTTDVSGVLSGSDVSAVIRFRVIEYDRPSLFRLALDTIQARSIPALIGRLGYRAAAIKGLAFALDRLL